MHPVGRECSLSEKPIEFELEPTIRAPIDRMLPRLVDIAARTARSARDACKRVEAGA